MGDLDLHGLTLVAVAVLPAALDELAGHEDRMPFFRLRLAFSATDRHAVQRKNPSLTSCHCPLCLEGCLTATVKPASRKCIPQKSPKRLKNTAGWRQRLPTEMPSDLHICVHA